VHALRPDWLLMAVDSTGAAAPEQVLVFVNGRLVGDVSTLRAFPTGNVGSLRLVAAQTVRETFPRFPYREFRVGIAVYTFTTPEEVPGRAAVSVGVGITPVGLAQNVEAGGKEAGVRSGTGDPRVPWPNRGTNVPLSAHVAARYDLRPAVSVRGEVQHTLEAWFGGYGGFGGGLASTRFSSTEASVIMAFGRLLRIGAGPAVRHVRWDWASNLCACETVEKRSGTFLGAAAFAGVSLPQGGRWFADFGVRARYYPSQEFGPYRNLESLDAGGLSATPAVSFGVRF
jgi:hypothetical protein